MAIKTKKTAAKSKATIETTQKDGGTVVATKIEEVDLGTATFEDQPAVVIFKHGETINKGDFQSARIDVGIHIPCKIDDVDVTFEGAIQWVEERLKLAIEKSNSPEQTKKNTLKESSHPF